MLKGYGINVEFDPKTLAPIITDQMIKELERKTRGKISDQMDLKPGVKIIEKSPEKEKVREKGLFMTKYDNQTGFPRITKDMYHKAKENTNIILKEKVEEELAKRNAAHITPEVPQEKIDSARDSTYIGSRSHIGSMQNLQPVQQRPMQQRSLFE